LPVRFQGTARKWDSMQSRSFLVDTCYDKKDKSRKERAMYTKEMYLQQFLFKENFS